MIHINFWQHVSCLNFIQAFSFSVCWLLFWLFSLTIHTNTFSIAYHRHKLQGVNFHKIGEIMRLLQGGQTDPYFTKTSSSIKFYIVSCYLVGWLLIFFIDSMDDNWSNIIGKSIIFVDSLSTLRPPVIINRIQSVCL